MNCPTCGKPAELVSHSRGPNDIYRCLRGHAFAVVKPLAEQGTAAGRSSYRNPDSFGPETLPAKVLAYLRLHPYVDDTIARREWNHTRIAATVHILRTNGYPVETLPRQSGQVARYRLPEAYHR
jgi:hypothetical protein